MPGSHMMKRMTNTLQSIRLPSYHEAARPGLLGVPARLVVFDTESGKIVASPAMVEHTDDLFYDAGKGRIYVLGEGFIDVWRQMDPDHYDRIGRVATPTDSRTGLFVPDLGELFETTPHGAQGAQIGVYSIQ